MSYNINGSPLVPTGTVIWVATPTVPANYLECNGQAVSRNTYINLFAAISTTFGSGDGSTTFNLPDLRDYFVRGYNSTTSSTRAFGSKQDDSNKSHNHSATVSISDPTHSHTATSSVSISDPKHSHTATTSASDSGHAHNGYSSTINGWTSYVGSTITPYNTAATPVTAPYYAEQNQGGGPETYTGFGLDTPSGYANINASTTVAASGTGITASSTTTVAASGTGITASSTINNSGDTESRPKNIVLLACIKY
jgi:microcystin-dependent protein